MGSGDGVVEIGCLERGLLADNGDYEMEDESVLYTASFKEKEDNYVKSQTAQWVLYSLLLILAWGIGLFMLLYLPVRRFILREDIRSRKLYVTPNSIIYKVKRPVPFPCFGVLKKEKHILLHSVADIVVEQGYLQSYFGVYSVRIENVGVRRPPNDDVRIQGIVNPNAFRKAVLTRLSDIKSEAFSRQASTVDDSSKSRIGSSSASWPEELILQKLEEVGSSIKRVQTLLEEKHS